MSVCVLPEIFFMDQHDNESIKQTLCSINKRINAFIKPIPSSVHNMILKCTHLFRFEKCLLIIESKFDTICMNYQIDSISIKKNVKQICEHGKDITIEISRSQLHRISRN